MDYFLKAPTVQYCEAAMNALIARPWYAISNIAFLIVGIIILLRGGRRSRLFGSIAIVVGLLSFTYDASYTYLSQLLDLSGMLVFISALLYLNLRLLVISRQKLMAGFILSFVIAICLIMLFKGFAGDVIFGLFVLGYIASEVYLMRTKRHTKGRLWLLAFGIFVLGFLFWLCDATRVYCADIGLFNGRAIFHYTNAVAIYLLWSSYRSQEK